MPNTLLRDEARRRTSLISGCAYDIALDLTKGDERFGCITTLTFECAEPGADIFLDFICDRVASIELNGQQVDLAGVGDDRIAIPNLAARNTLVITAQPVYEHTGVGLHRFVDPVDGNVYMHTQFEAYSARRVFPCFDQPDIKATFTLTVRAPGDWQVASNTEPVRDEDGDAAVWRFPATKVMSTYITALVAGPFHIVKDKHGSIDLGLWCRQSLVQYLEPDEMFDFTKKGFDFYEDLFGYSYPFGKYDQLFVPEFNAGAMENAGCVTFSEAYVFRSKVTDARRERRAATILHEMAHMWFGDLVTMRWWDDLWLNESFAEYVALVAQIRATRFTNGFVTFADAEKTWAYRQDQLPTTHPIAADCPDVESAEVNFDGISYAKGASVLKQLVAWVGEDHFYEGLRAYFRRYEYGNADLLGFLDELERSSGRDLQAWAKEWLQTPGVNTLRVAVVVAGDSYESVTIMQEVPSAYPTHRSHRVAVGLYDKTPQGIVRRTRVELDVLGEQTVVEELRGEKTADLLLVNDDDLTFAKIRLDDRSLATLRTGIRDIVDPLARSLCLSMVWDMVRDAELGARDYAQIVYANAESESDIGVLRSLLDKVRSSALVYGEPSNRDAALHECAAYTLAHLQTQKPGTDHQLVWAQSFIASARTLDHVAIVRGMLDGSSPFDGLAIDTDLRWLIVRSLAAVGAIGDAEISAEFARDKTDQGERHAAASRASLPSEQAKEAAWKVITDESTTFAMMRSVMGGFQSHEQEALLRPYRDRYFATLADLYKTRDLPVAMEFAEDMFPHVLVSEDTERTTEEYLRSQTIAPPIRRFVLEGLDGLQRAVRGRRRDARG